MKPKILDQIFTGMRLDLHAFGPAIIRRLYVQTGSKEVCADLRADSGETLHLSMRYLERLYQQGGV